MREYRYQATDATIEALRRLKAPWQAATHHEGAFVVRVDDTLVRLSVEREDVESVLEVQRIRADIVPAMDAGLEYEAAHDVPVAGLGEGRNDVVLFTGETWAEEPAGTGASGNGTEATPPQVLQLSGRAGQRPASAAVVCTTTDAVVIAAATGEGVLVRIGARPLSLDVIRDRATIGGFLVLRGYAAGEEDG